jgi:hypothetical protein
MNTSERNIRTCFWSAVILAALVPLPVLAEVPAILIEACSLLEPAAKRVECLKVANRQSATESATGYTPQSLYSTKTQSTAVTPSTQPSLPRVSLGALSGQTCFVGPRGGTYTITKSGRKNYGGC